MRWLESLTEDSASLQAYLQAIARFPALSGDEEATLAERARRRDADATTRLVESHLGLVVRYVRRYQDVGMPLLALVRDGNRALLEAARRFDPARHGRFGAFALWWVRQAVLHRMAQVAPSDGAPSADLHDGRVADALRAAVDYVSAPGETRVDELTAHDLRRLDAWWRLSPPADAAVAEEPLDLRAVAPALDQPEEIVRRALAADLEIAMGHLEPRERRALERSLGLDSAPGRGRLPRPRGAAGRMSRLSSRAVRKLCGQRSLTSALN